MTWKAGDTAPFTFYVETLAGAAVTFATYAAFQEAGCSLLFSNGATPLTSQPSIAAFAPNMLPSGAIDAGWHSFTFQLPAGVIGVRVIVPPTLITPNDDTVLVVPQSDTDSLAAAFSSSIGTPSFSPGSTQSSYAITVPEFDSWGRQFQIPVSALQVLDPVGQVLYSWTSLANIGGQPWTITCSARYVDGDGPLPFDPIAFAIGAAIINPSPGGSTAGIVAIGWVTAPAAAVIDSYGATATATESGGVVQNTVQITNGGMYYNEPPPVTITDGGSGSGTGATGTAVVSNGQVTGVIITSGGANYSSPVVTIGQVGDPTISSRTFNLDIRLTPPSGSSYATAKLTPIAGTVTLTRKQTT